MTNEQVERAIEFLIEHHSKVSADIERNSDQIAQLTAAVAEVSADIERHSDQIAQLTAAVAEMRVEMRAGFDETRRTIDDLIVANEVTRKLAEDVARLAITTSQRVTNLESNR